MALFNFLKTVKPIQFDFKPRYYDEEKEARAKRLKELEDRRSTDVEDIKERISNGFRRGADLSAMHDRRKQVMRSNIIVMALIVILALAAYVFINFYVPSAIQR